MPGLLLAMLLLQAPPMSGEEGCPDGFRPIAGNGCVALPLISNGKVVVYFHGMVPSPWSRTVRPELMNLTRELTPKGYTLIAFRGERGLCNWSEEVRSWWCWPNGLSQVSSVPRVLERVKLALPEAARLTQTRMAPPAVVGFSNGGFFTTLVASDSRLNVSAYVVAHGGPVIGQAFPPYRKRPVLLLGATQDSIQLPLMKQLRTMLDQDGWWSAFSEHEGVHELTAEDARTMTAFFERL